MNQVTASAEDLRDNDYLLGGCDAGAGAVGATGATGATVRLGLGISSSGTTFKTFYMEISSQKQPIHVS